MILIKWEGGQRVINQLLIDLSSWCCKPSEALVALDSNLVQIPLIIDRPGAIPMRALRPLACCFIDGHQLRTIELHLTTWCQTVVRMCATCIFLELGGLSLMLLQGSIICHIAL